MSVPFYTAFGLCIASTLPLPELRPGGGRADVRVRVRSMSPDVDDVEDTACIEPGETRFTWHGTGAFTIRAGREILVEPLPSADARALRVGVLGPAMAALLQQRSVLALHASVVVRDGRAVAFLGSSGSGKSTTAAALRTRGFTLLTDDLAAVRIADGRAEVHPGVAICKLLPDAILALGLDPDALPIADPEDGKRFRAEDGDVGAIPVPLTCLYLLEEGGEPRIEPVAPAERFLEIVRNSYGIEWMHHLTGPTEFALRSALARAVPMRRLIRPHQLGGLGYLADLVAADEPCRS